MCLFNHNKKSKEISINFFQTENESWVENVLGKKINKDIYTYLSEDINIGTLQENRFKYYYGKIPKHRLEIKIEYKEGYNIIILNNMYSRNYMDTYLEKTQFWKKMLKTNQENPLSYFLLYDTEKNILYPFMSFSKCSYEEEYFCLAYYPVHITYIVEKFVILEKEADEQSYINNTNLKKLFHQNENFIKYLNLKQ